MNYVFKWQLNNGQQITKKKENERNIEINTNKGKRANLKKMFENAKARPLQKWTNDTQTMKTHDGKSSRTGVITSLFKITFTKIYS